jgi:hypothetical protein
LKGRGEKKMAQNIGEKKIPMEKLMKELTMNIVITQGAISKIRMFIGLVILKLGAKVFGLGKVTVEENE